MRRGDQKRYVLGGPGTNQLYVQRGRRPIPVPPLRQPRFRCVKYSSPDAIPEDSYWAGDTMRQGAMIRNSPSRKRSFAPI